MHSFSILDREPLIGAGGVCTALSHVEIIARVLVLRLVLLLGIESLGNVNVYENLGEGEGFNNFLPSRNKDTFKIDPVV